MENSQIWLKPKPTHIDEYFEGFLNYLKTSNTLSDALYTESIRLLKERVALLLQQRTETPIYRQNKSPEVLKFNIRLCGAWLLAINNANKQERKQVLLTLINSLIYLSQQSTLSTLNSRTYAYRSVPELIDMAMKLTTHEPPAVLTFSWNDLINFSLDLFLLNFLRFCGI